MQPGDICRPRPAEHLKIPQPSLTCFRSRYLGIKEHEQIKSFQSNRCMTF